jgi:hypothetical protein
MGAHPSFGLDKLCCASYLGEEIEERIDALSQLRFDLLPRAFQVMHGDARRVAVFQLNGSLAHLLNFVGRQEP